MEPPLASPPSRVLSATPRQTSDGPNWSTAMNNDSGLRASALRLLYHPRGCKPLNSLSYPQFPHHSIFFKGPLNVTLSHSASWQIKSLVCLVKFKFWMNNLGHTYTTKLFIVYLKFKFNQASCIFNSLNLATFHMIHAAVGGVRYQGAPPDKLYEEENHRCLTSGSQEQKSLWLQCFST